VQTYDIAIQYADDQSNLQTTARLLEKKNRPMMDRLMSFLALGLLVCFTRSATLATTSPDHRHPSPAAATHGGTMTVTIPAGYRANSYRGVPDLGLTTALITAGGGAGHFDAAKLFRVLAGPKSNPERARLDHLYGKAKVDAFLQTFTFAMIELVQLFRDNHIALPAKPRIAPSDGRAMSLAVYRDGIMSNGKYDCGYMMEHLMTHPIHVVLMHQVDNERGHGPKHNANFHIMLTRVVLDLKKSYGA
jgi:hypothetical protein